MDENLFTMLADIRERIVGLETKLETIGNADAKATEALAEVKALKSRVDKLDKIVFWAGTTVIGSVILSLMAVIII